VESEYDLERPKVSTRRRGSVKLSQKDFLIIESMLKGEQMIIKELLSIEQKVQTSKALSKSS